MGGLQIPHPQQTIQGLQQNLIQNLFKKTLSQEETKLLQFLESTLISIGRPSLEKHVYYLGPQQWERTAKLLERQNVMFAQAFSSIGILLEILEDELESWAQQPSTGILKQASSSPFPPLTMSPLDPATYQPSYSFLYPMILAPFPATSTNYFTQPFPPF